MTEGRRTKLLLAVTLSETGGAQTYVAELAAAFARDHDVLVIAADEGPLKTAVESAGARYQRLRWMGRKVSWRDLLALVELIRIFRNERPDIVHLNSSKMGLLGRFAAALARLPNRVFTVHGWAFDAHEGLVAAIYRLSERLARPLTTCFVCPSAYHATLGTSVGACTPDRVVVIPNAVDVQSAPVHRTDGAPPMIVSVGRFKAPKDFVLLCEALSELPRGSFRAVLLGDGPDRGAIEAAIATTGIGDAVDLPGTVSDVSERLARADIFVLASDSECFPISILEAMAAGLPVVATSVGGIPESVIDGETGLLVNRSDRNSLRDAIKLLLDDPERRRAMGIAGRTRALERFDRGPFSDAHRRVYAQILQAS